jgi:uncharacterized protein
MGLRLARELDTIEIRVLGSLLEKQQSTPEAYPLTLNALIAACNQKSNREPVTELSEDEVLGALERLREHVLVWKIGGTRVEKWEQNLDAKLGLDAPARAILTLLFLRGPQTPGELRSRSDRLHPFASLPEVESGLRALAGGLDPLVVEMPRRAGQKENRWAQLLGAPPSDDVRPERSAPAESLTTRLERLEGLVSALTVELSELKKRLGEG